MAPSFGMAYFKAEERLNLLPLQGTVFISVADSDKETYCVLHKNSRRLAFKLRPLKELSSFCRRMGLIAH
jgi:hypothetical protein